MKKRHAMKKLILISAALLLLPALTEAQGSVEVSGSVAVGGRTLDNDTNSSKLTEYRDLRDDAYLPELSLNVLNKSNGWYLDLSGANLSLDDRTIRGRGGRPGTWKLGLDWTGIPHNFSNKAQTPYLRSGPGQFDVASNVPITLKKLATAGPDAPGVVASDALIAAYQAGALRPTSLATNSGTGRVSLQYEGLEDFRFGMSYDRRVKDGLRPTFGPIGDRPPRTLNIQFTEPVDYRTQDLTLSAEWVGSRYQAQLSYLFSDFANAIDTLTWENVFATPATAGASFDTWDRSVSTFGRRPLAPDNRYHNVTLSLAAELPADSRLSATLAYGRLEQDQTLQPYSFNSDVLVNSTLPRATADARMSTRQLLVDYVVPVSRLNLRAWARYNGLDNGTPSAQWQYVTSDTSNLNGTVSFKNKRVNLPYAADTLNAGAEASYRLGLWNSSLNVGFERESVDRDYREADTDENRLSASLRVRPASWARLRARYVYGKRDGDYDPFVTRESYWYARSEAGTDQDNPRFTFSNHPDMVRFDVSDRQRHQGDAALTLTPGGLVSVTASVRYRSDDFDSEVRPIQPLASTGFGDVSAKTPGDQLGLLEHKQTRYALDASYLPTERVSLNAFVSWEKGRSLQRGLEFNENNKGNPGTVATAELGPWTRRSSQWTADFDDRTWTAGLGSNVRLRDRVTLSASYTLSLGDIDLAYGGYGVTNWDGTPYPANHQFAWPEDVEPITHDLHLVDVRLEFPLVRDVSAVLGYGYERYRIDDWAQGTDYPWVEAVGSEFLLRDSSRSYQWGNRLFNLGSYLAPRYDAHIGWLAFTYRF